MFVKSVATLLLITRSKDGAGRIGCSFGVQNRPNGMDDARNTDDSKNGLLRDTFLTCDTFVGIDTLAAGIDRRDSQRPELEVDRVGAVGADDVHAQTGRNGAVFLV